MDLKAILKEELANAGAEVAEEAAIAALKGIMKAAPRIAAATENTVDDMFIPVLALIEPKLIELLDQINKADNE